MSAYASILSAIILIRIHFHTLLPSHNQKKDNKFKNKKQPELPKNQPAWKSDNQGVKEETFIQTAPQRCEVGCPALANT